MVKSKFTFYFRPEPYKLLMYNSLRGTSSFIKFYGDDVAIVEECINNPDKYSKEKVFKVMEQYGMIVPADIDEEAICAPISWKRIFDSCLTLIVMPTEDCNFRCSYCYESHKKGVMKKHTVDAIVKYVGKNISSHTELRVVWFGGEPLMSTDTIEIIKTLSDKLMKICSCARKKYSAEIITNGYNLSLSVFEELLRCKVFSYQITIDGTASTHDKQRFLNNHEKTHDVIISNLMNIKCNCKKQYFSVVIRTNITLEMEDSLIEHYTELSEKFSDDSRFLFFFRPVGNWGGNRVKLLCDNMYSQSSFKQVYKLLYSVQDKLQLNFGRFSSFYDNSTCSACYENSYIIGFDGAIYKCSCHFEESDNKIGFLEDNGTMRINNYLKNKWVNAPLLKNSCKDCFFVPVCSNMACPIYTNGIKTGFDGIDDCPYEKRYIKETLLLLENNGFFKTITI